MTRAGFGLWLGLLSPLPAMADGPALAHLTIEGRTITLTALARPADDATDLSLSFAQHHLGFPLPPQLSVALENVDGTWTLTAFSLERGLGAQPLAFGIAGLQLSYDDPTSTRFEIAGDGLAPGAQMVPVHVEITLTSP